MRCYYEELGISREADDKEIKNSYRKLALRHHPDKNPEHLKEEAKERFQVIQQAYEVLSDPQERAFYDKHREQILRGKNSNYEDNTVDLFQYFTISCFKGYGDDKKGFYATYCEVFKKIAAEDAEFMDEKDDPDEIPEFGNSTSTYEDIVGPFYAYWQSYCTKKTYAWLCPYDIQEVKDRRVLRAIDKEMKKVVQNAKRERNEEVRSLVSFVRKRDKRVQAYSRQLEEKAALNRKKQEQNRREQLLRRQRELEEMRAKSKEIFSDGYEQQLKELEQEYGADSDTSQTDDDDDDDDASGDEDDEERELDFADEFFCVACTKAFKNQNAFDNHALSKKHRENEERLKAEMLEEEETLSNMRLNNAEVNGHDTDEESLDAKNLDEGNEEAALDNEEDCDKKANTRKNKKNKKSKKNISKLVEIPDEEEIDESFILPQESDKSDNDDWNSSNKKNTRKNQNKKQNKNIAANKITEKVPEKESTLAQAAEEAQVLPETSTKNHTCVTCNSNFESKNKLFAHLKKTNHGVYIPKNNTPTAEIAKTKPKGKRK